MIMKAAVDIGTNSIRMLVGIPRGQSVELHGQYVEETRLGEGMAGKILLPQAMGRTVVALKKFQHILAEQRIAPPRVIATSAVRDAENQAEFCQLVRQETGWAVEVLSGEQEALYSYHGALSLGRPGAGLPVVIDIGGGSSEVVFALGGRIRGRSVNIGAVRLLEKPLAAAELQAILAPAVVDIRESGEMTYLIGVGGTATTAAAIFYRIADYSRQSIQGRILQLVHLEIMRENLAAMTPAERRLVVGLPVKRADIIVPGLAILTALLQLLGASQIMISDAGILDGVLTES